MRITEQGISSFVSALFIVGIVGSAVPVGAGGTCGTSSLSTHLAAELYHGQLVLIQSPAPTTPSGPEPGG
jgi:hypothetical protein